MGEAIDRTDLAQDSQVVRARTDHEHRDVAAFELVDHLAHRLGAGGVEHLQIGEAQDHHLDVADRRELVQVLLDGAEEQRPVQAVRHDLVVQQLGCDVDLDQWERVGDRHRRDRQVPQRQDRSRGHADLDGEDQVEGDGDERGDHEDERVGARGPRHRPDVVDVDHPHGGHHQHAGERGERDVGNELGAGEHDAEQHDRVDDRRQAGGRAGLHVHGRTGDRTGGRHPTEQRRHDVGEALADQFAVRVVAPDTGRAVGDLGGQQALEGRQRRHRDDRAEHVLRHSERDVGQLRRGQGVGNGADHGHVEPGEADEHGGDHDRQQRGGGTTVDAGHHDHHRHDDPDQGDRPPHTVAAHSVAKRAPRHRRRVLAFRLGDTERRRHLLEEDDDGDAEREAFDHRPRHEGEEPPEAGHPGDHDEDTGQQADDEHRLDTVTGHDRHEDDRHRPGRTGHLDVRTAEHGGDDTGDDRRDQPGSGAESRRRAERQCQWQRDDPDGQPGDEIGAPGRRDAGVVGAPRCEHSNAREHGCGAHVAVCSASRPASRSRVSSSDAISSLRATASSSTNVGSLIA